MALWGNSDNLSVSGVSAGATVRLDYSTGTVTGSGTTFGRPGAGQTGDVIRFGTRYTGTYYGDAVIVSIASTTSLTIGSTEGLRITGGTVSRGGGEIIAAKPTFLALTDYAQKWGATINWVPVSSDMGYDLDEIEKRISKKTKILVFDLNKDIAGIADLDKNSMIQPRIVFNDSNDNPDYQE